MNNEYVYEMGPARQAGTCFGCELYHVPAAQRQPGACVSAKCQPDTSVSGEHEIVIAIHRRDAVMGAVPQGPGQVRNTDPSTSAAAAKAPRKNLRERVYALCCVYPGVTGTEAAEKLEAKLNSVTPRFAELRRAERIKDSGLRRDGQIVWQGVAS